MVRAILDQCIRTSVYYIKRGINQYQIELQVPSKVYFEGFVKHQINDFFHQYFPSITLKLIDFIEVTQYIYK